MDDTIARKQKPSVDNQVDWSRIVQSPFAGAYLSELYWLARDVVETCERVFAAEPPPAESSYIKVDHRLHGDIYRVLNSAARIRALVKDRPKRRDQSAGQYAIQKQRTAWLHGLVADLPMATVLHAKVRHTLEHFDEYLDETALESKRDQIAKPTLLPIDIALGRDGTLNQFANGAVVYPIRLYLVEERVFINCGQRIDLGRMANECLGISKRLAALAPNLVREGDERGSFLLLVTNASFPDPSQEVF